MKKPGISILYFLIGIMSIILQNQSSFYSGFIAKALIIPVLMILFLVNINPLTSRLHMFMIAGLFFSWAGDVILEFSKNNGNIFILGLACYLLAHIMYFTVFFITPGKNSILSNRIWLLIPVIIYGVVLVSCLYSDLAEMRLPVIMYAIVILTMLTGAINRKEKVKKESYYLVLAGAILFVISDSVIAINKFSHQFESSGIVIMSTYIVAQYLIIAGYIYQFHNVKPDQISR
jgi:Predicted membrane protein